VQENKTIMHIAQSMKQDPSISIDLIPGCTQFVTGHTASGVSYDRQSNLFFKDNFNMVDNQTGELASKNTSGFRTAIIGLSKSKDRWFINSVSATCEDQITLNGLPESAAIKQQQQPAQQQQPVQQQQQQPPVQQQQQQPVQQQQSYSQEVLSGQPAQQQQPDTTQGPSPSDYESYNDADFDMDNLISGSDEMINEAHAMFEQESSSQMGQSQ
jgi:DNA segregation ATPase FtsK/SpoIIIE-like protein